jgi:Holliday junction resolvasome RuvABC ATP-dependent DNA helicase subunit
MLPHTNILPCQFPYYLGAKSTSQCFSTIITALLDGEEVINLYGKPGIGKTRLALEIQSYLRSRHQYQNGIFIVDLKHNKNFMQEIQMINSN